MRAFAQRAANVAAVVQIFLLGDEYFPRGGLVATGSQRSGELMVGLRSVITGVVDDQVQPLTPVDRVKRRIGKTG
jgi:hypothetical protein